MTFRFQGNGLSSLNSQKAALKNLIESLSELPAVWATEPRPFISPSQAAIITMTWRLHQQLGDRDIRRYFDNVTQAYTLEYNVTRTATISIRCESYGDQAAYELLDRLAIKLNYISSQETLNTQNMALVEILAITDIPNQPQDNRLVSTANLDIQLAVVAVDSLIAPTDLPTWIQTIVPPAGTVD